MGLKNTEQSVRKTVKRRENERKRRKESKRAQKALNLSWKRAQTASRVRRYRATKEFQRMKHIDNVIRVARRRRQRSDDPLLETRSLLAFTVARVAALVEWPTSVPLRKGLECGYLEPQGAVSVFRSGKIVAVHTTNESAVNESWVVFNAHNARGKRKKPTNNKLPRLVAVSAVNVDPLVEEIPRSESGYDRYSDYMTLFAALARKFARQLRTADQWRPIFAHTPRPRQRRTIGPKSKKARRQQSSAA